LFQINIINLVIQSDMLKDKPVLPSSKHAAPEILIAFQNCKLNLCKQIYFEKSLSVSNKSYRSQRSFSFLHEWYSIASVLK